MAARCGSGWRTAVLPVAARGLRDVAQSARRVRQEVIFLLKRKYRAALWLTPCSYSSSGMT